MADNFPDLKLNDGSKALDPNKNDYFLVTITDLLPGKTYPIEFRWNYKDPSKKGDWGAVLNITTTAYAPDAVTSLVASWENEIFKLTFTHDRTLNQNKNVLYYKVKIVATDSTERVFQLLPKTGNSQVFSLEYSRIVEAFGIPLSAFSGSVIAVDKDGNESTAATFPLTTATTSLPAPTIIVSAVSGGYTVSYTTPSSTTYPNYSYINIEEVESSAGSDPGAGYGVVFSGVANPIVMSRSTGTQRWVRARFYSKLGLPGPYGTAYAITPTPAVVIDSTAPSAPASGSVTAGIDTSSGSTVGFNAYLDISWSAVSDATLKGYRIRFRKNGSSDPYSYVDSPGTGTTFRLNGLSIGVTYEVGVASYDEFNNTTGTYTSLGTGTASGTPYIGKNVSTTGYFEAAPSGETGAFRFGYGVESGKRGLTFNSNNYWYIDSAASALFKLGGDTNNYISWDGGTFNISGNIIARSGTFSGNVQVSGGSLYAGSSPSSGARLAISSSGLTAYDSNGSATTNIYSNAGAGGVTFTTTAGTIGNWSITSSSITKTSSSGTLTLDSSNAKITANSGSYFSGISAPVNNLPSDIVIYAGSSSPSSAPFRVRADGGVTMTNATITGYATGDQLSTGLSGKISTGGAASDVNNNSTTITGNRIRTGSIEGTTYSYSSGNFSDSGMQIDLTNNRIRSPQFAIDGGSAYFKGNITGATGTFSDTIQIGSGNGQITINSNGLSVGSGKFSINSSGNASFSGNITTATINVTGETFSDGTNDSEGTAGVGTLGASNAFSTQYVRNSITNLGINGISLMSANTAGVISSWYPYLDGVVDLGIKSGSTYNTYRWRNLRLTGDAYWGGDGSTNNIDSTTFGGAVTKIYSDGRIYANTLGTTSSNGQGAVYQDSTGFLRIRTGTGSSRNIKDNIELFTDISNYSQIINNMELVTFNYKPEIVIDPEIKQLGMIVEDLVQHTDNEFLIEYKNDEPSGIHYDKIPLFLVGAFQEMNKKINELQQRLDALEG